MPAPAPGSSDALPPRSQPGSVRGPAAAGGQSGLVRQVDVGFWFTFLFSSLCASPWQCSPSISHPPLFPRTQREAALHREPPASLGGSAWSQPRHRHPRGVAGGPSVPPPSAPACWQSPAPSSAPPVPARQSRPEPPGGRCQAPPALTSHLKGSAAAGGLQRGFPALSGCWHCGGAPRSELPAVPSLFQTGLARLLG